MFFIALISGTRPALPRSRYVDWEWSRARWYAYIRSVKTEIGAQVLNELARG